MKFLSSRLILLLALKYHCINGGKICHHHHHHEGVDHILWYTSHAAFQNTSRCCMQNALHHICALIIAKTLNRGTFWTSIQKKKIRTIGGYHLSANSVVVIIIANIGIKCKLLIVA